MYEDRVITNFQGKNYQKKMPDIIVLHLLQSIQLLEWVKNIFLKHTYVSVNNK